MKKNTIYYTPTSKLKPYSNNARLHDSHQISQIASSILAFDFINPIVTDQENNIIAGHGRWLAAKKIGLKTIPCVYADHLSDEQVKAYRIADNKLALNAQWDESLLRTDLKFLQEFDVHYDFSTLGFETAEIDNLLNVSANAIEDAQEEILPDTPDHPITQVGDIYHCGPHRIGCGDCRDQSFLNKLFKRSKASICITDPPYNVPISGHVRGNGQHHFSEFMMASGEMTQEEFRQFLLISFISLKHCCKEGALFYLFTDWRHLSDLFYVTDELFTEMINLCVWNKSNGGMGSLYRSKHELVGVFKHGKAAHTNNVQLGKFGRDRTNVWDYPGVSSFGKEREQALAMHPTVKPVELLKDILLDASNPNEIVVDGFLGSGSTLIAAEKVHRRCFGVEIDPKYVDVTLQRYLNETGNEPIHVETGLTFTGLADQRLQEREVGDG